MSITFRSSIPTLVFCAGIVFFVLGWRTLGVVVALAPVVIGLLVLIWALAFDSASDS
jgi:hypothetical protein